MKGSPPRPAAKAEEAGSARSPVPPGGAAPASPVRGPAPAGKAKAGQESPPASPLVPAAPVRLLRRIPCSQLIEDWKRTLGLDIADQLAGFEEVHLYRCQASQVDFFTPPAAAGKTGLYEKLRKLDWYFMADKWEFTEALRDLAGRRQVLEVGSGTGLFVERAGRELKGARVQGVEWNENAVLQARRENRPVERMDLAERIRRGETFDGACCFQVLEHLDRPREFLEALVRLLVPGALLILSVPNRESFLRHQYNLLDMPPHHMTRWNRRAFAYLPRLLPLKLLRLRDEPLAPYHVGGYVEAYSRLWRERAPFLRRFLSDERAARVSRALRRGRLHRLLRGQSLYGIFVRS